MIPEILSMTDRILSHFGQFFALLSPLLNNPKNQNFEKMKKKKTPEDIIILHKSAIYDNHMI